MRAVRGVAVKLVRAHDAFRAAVVGLSVVALTAGEAHADTAARSWMSAPRVERCKLCPQAAPENIWQLRGSIRLSAAAANRQSMKHVAIDVGDVFGSRVACSANIGEVRYCSRACQQANWKDTRDFN